MYRHGYEKANKKENEWPIMEVGANDNPFDDPWEKQRSEKRARVDQNIERRMKNEERAGNMPKGATNRTVKARQKAYEVGKEAGRKDSRSLPVGLPLDLQNSTDPRKAADNKLRGKKSTLDALSTVQKSTASLGKFDRMREGEPERKKALSSKKKRKFENPTDKKVIMSEGQSSMKILNAVMNGGGVTKAKAIRKGQYAKGETAYDYEFDDGLGASSFKKKKGRAGAGKMKKMTKKRAK
jgi:regulator of ribosome biosynthesis